ncbi:MAG: DNA-3-methyladenine glycosylase I [Pseudomonadota bacterium]
MERCAWAGDDPLYHAYHDEEWGVPERRSRALWEALVLEGFQAGLSWITILRKREAFRTAFAGFDPDIVATWGEREVAHLLQDAGIVRHRGKIEATISNARAWQKIEAEQGFSTYIWNFVDGQPVQTRPRQITDIPAQTRLSAALSKDLKTRGFRFCGPTTVYAFMQAKGLVNDHLLSCPRHSDVMHIGRGGR